MKRFRQSLSLIVLIAVFLWAAISIAMRRTTEVPPGARVIRIGHWQLESGVRDGFDALAADFSKLPAIRAKYGEVRVVQDAIPESIYGQWVSTQMMGGTAPDLVEVGLGLPSTIWLAYQNRYFEPFSDLVDAPNPFNKGTPLEGVPLKNTLFDGMRSGYQEELQQYMRISLSRLTSRVFYNRDLLERLTGLDKPPSEYRAFIELCRRIGLMRNSDGEFYTPIASSKYHVGMWQNNLFDPLTYSLLFKVDFNRDGTVGNDETFVGFRRGILSFNTPAVRAKFEAAAEVQRNFQPGYTGLTRDEAVFLFAQQRAVFISTGTWDAGGLVEQAKGKFTVGVMGYPQPLPTDPEFGSLILGPNFDAIGQGFPFGITRFSKNPELARDFLLYLVSYEGNRKLNEIIGWIPGVIGAPPPPLLRDFKPVNQGMYPAFNTDLGGNTLVKYQQLYSRFQNDPNYTYDDLARDFGPFYHSMGLQDWDEQQRDWRRSVVDSERLVASMRGEALLANASANQPDWIRYRAYTAARLVFPDIGHAVQQRMVRLGDNDPIGPYQYRPEAIERIRAQVKERATTRPLAMGGDR